MTDFLASLRPEARAIPESGIVAVVNVGRTRQGLIPLWVGEGDQPTPDFISDAARASLSAGETFYTYQRGIPDLRQAIAAYMTRIYGSFAGAPFTPERFFVTNGGMHAIQIALRMVAGPGDQVLIPTPAWPNFAASLIASGATPVEVPMSFGPTPAGVQWSLDLTALEAALTPQCRAIVINSPSNPTGWTASIGDLEAVLDLARRHDLWIIADEIYGRLSYTGSRAPSFHDVMNPDDKVMFVQTLSKNWAMTGWRIGWLEAPPQMGAIIENLVQFTTSGVPVTAQRAAIAALNEGEPFIAAQIERYRKNRDLLCEVLSSTTGIAFAQPQSAFYLFCHFEGENDTLKLALRLIEEANIGVAPGATFGAAGAPFVRLCFARKTEDIVEVTRRLRHWLTHRS